MKRIIWNTDGKGDDAFGGGELLSPAHAIDGSLRSLQLGLPELPAAAGLSVADVAFVGPIQIAAPGVFASIKVPIAPPPPGKAGPVMQPAAAPEPLLAAAETPITQAQVNLFIQGFEQQLTKIEANLIAQVFGDDLPLLGNNLVEAAAQGVQALHYVTGLKAAINSGLGALTGAATYTEVQVEQAINSALSSASIIGGANLDTSNPADIKLFLTSSDTFAAFNAPLEAGFALPGLGLQSSGSVNTALTYTFNFGVGLDAQGFYLNTTDGASQFAAGLTTSLSGLDLAANLSRLKFQVTNGTSPTQFTGNFVLDLRDPSGPDNKLRLNEIDGTDLLDATLSGSAGVNLHLASNLGDAALPSISADLNFGWGFNTAPVVAGDANTTFGSVPTLAFKNVKLDLGTFFSKFARPVLEKVRDATAPLKPVIDALLKEIPILEQIQDLTGEDIPTTMLEYMEVRGSISSEDAARIELLDKLIDLAENVPDAGTGVMIDLGDFDILGSDPRGINFKLAQAADHLLRPALKAIQQNPILNDFITNKVGSLPGGGAAGMKFPIIEDPRTAFGLLLGKDVEIFTYDAPDFRPEPPPEIDQFYRITGPIGVRLKGGIDAFVKLDFGYDTRGLIDFATDPNGPFSDLSKIFNGFYVVDQEGPEAWVEGRATASLALNFAVLEAGVGGGILGKATAGLHDPTPGDGKVRLNELLNAFQTGGCLLDVEGHVSALLSAYVTIGIDDPFGFGLLKHTFTFDGPGIELINLEGISCDGIGTATPAVLAHNVSAAPAALQGQGAAALAGDVILHVGPDAYQRVGGVISDIAEDIRIIHVLGGAGSETVALLGFGVDPLIVNAGGGRITGNAGLFDDALRMDANVLTPAEFRGGAGNDALSGGAANDVLFGNENNDVLIGNGGDDILEGGADFDVLDGGAGIDTLRGGLFDDILIGGPGADVLDGGSGDDTASYRTATAGIVVDFSNLAPWVGDTIGDTFISIERIFGSEFGDTILGGSSDEYFAGGAGNDTLTGRGGNDLLVGGPGGDALNGGSGVDLASYVDAREGVTLSLLTGTGSAGEAAGDTFQDIENVEGTDFDDTIDGDNLANWLRGHGGNNTLRGQGGNDVLDGGKGNDLLDGGDGDDLLRADIDGQATIVTSEGPGPGTGLPEGGNDTLLGGAGNDTLDAGAGSDSLDGGPDNDQLFGGKGIDQLAGGTGNDLLEGGDGDDTLDGGDGDDDLRGQLGNDTITGAAGDDDLDGADGNDVLHAGDGANSILGGAGDDTFTSGGGADTIVLGIGNDSGNSGAGNDTVNGEDGNDALHGGVGFDILTGGNGNDLLEVGDLRGAVQDLIRNDHIFGGAGFDTITADFSTQTVPITIIAGQTHTYVFADGAQAHDFENVHDFATGSADDVIRLNTASDDLFGNFLLTGAGNDVVYSGAGVDYVDLGPGDDFVNGGPGRATDTPLPPPVVVPYPRWEFVGGQLRVVGYTGNILIGGPGIDTVEFEPLFVNTQAPFQGQSFGHVVGAIVNLGTGFTDNAASGTVLTGFENVIGTDYQDSLTGDAGPNVFQPKRGGGYGAPSTSGPDGVYGGDGEDTLIIDYSREDLPTSTGINWATNLGGPVGGYSRQTPDSPVWPSDSVGVQNVEHCIITGASKDDRLGPSNSYGFSDVLIGLGGNDIIWGLNGSDTLLGGPGNDSLYGLSTFFTVNIANPNVDGTDILDGGDGDDIIVDFHAGNIGVEPVPAVNAIIQADGGPGFDILSPDFGNQTAPIVWNDATPTNLEFANGAYARNFERTRYFGSGSGDDSITQSGRVDNWIYTRGGNDVITPGLGNDNVNGGTGNDLVILDFSIMDLPEYGGLVRGGGGTTISTARPHPGGPILYVDSIFAVEVERMHLTATSKADAINDLVGDDVIITGAGNDNVICGSGGNNYVDLGEGDDIITGASTFSAGLTADDTILGGPGNDTIDAGNGEDIVFGGPGNDVIRGDSNSARFGGRDTFDAGEGDDVVDEWVAQVSDSTFAIAGTRLQLDGGPGFDTLFADFGYATQAIVLDMSNPQTVEHADGGYIRNFELIRDFVTGAGNDVLIQLGRINNDWATRSGDDIVNPGLGAFDRAVGGPGDDLLILDYSVGDDPNVGGVTFSANFQSFRRDITTNQFVDYITTASFERHLIIGSSKADSFQGGPGVDVFDGRGGADTMAGAGGNDFYSVDVAGDVVTEFSASGIDTVRAIIDYNLGPEVDNLVLLARAIAGNGNSLANIIAGNARNNVLNGGGGNDVIAGGFVPGDTPLAPGETPPIPSGAGIGLAGSREIDVLTGGTGADMFILGDVDFRYYDDRSSLSPGITGYARITDFTPSTGDKLKLKGAAAEYFLGASPVAGVPGTGLFHDTTFNGIFDAGFDELIAILESPDVLTPANTINVAIYI